MRGAVVNRDNIWTEESPEGKKTDSQEEMLANISGIFVIQHFPHFLNLLFYNVSRIGETAQKLKEN